MNGRQRRQRKDSAESLFPDRGPPGNPGFGRGRGRAMSRPMASPPARPAGMEFEPGKQAKETLCDHMEELWVQGEGVDAQSGAGSLATAARIRDEILEEQEQIEPETLREMDEEMCRTMCDIDMASKASSSSRATLLGLAQALESQKAKGLQWGLMGSLAVQGDAWMPPTQRSVVLNTTAPFCLVTVGVQGGGKSHTLATVMENCRLNCAPISNTPRPNSTLVFHYDSDEGNCCEAATLTQVRGALPEGIQRAREDNLLVLVSPSFFRQRWRFYRSWPNCNVIPLLFRWRDLAASEISTLMHLKDKVDDVPLYMAVLLDMLRRYQKQDRLPTFPSFKQDLEAQGFSAGQCAPLSQRLQLLESLLYEAECNQDLRVHSQCSPKELFADSTMVIADMTDPMLAAAEASDIFQVLLRQFLSSPSRHGKLVVFDEAHKYLNTTGKKDELSGTVVQLVRQMRHHGMRVAISTQTPRTLPEELLELVSIAVIHRFHSADWFSYLRKKLPLAEGAMDRIMDLPPGSALVYCGAWDDDLAGHDAWPFGRGVQEMCIRMRITRDGGVSKMSREPGLT